MINLLLLAIAIVWPFGQIFILSPLSSSFRFHLLDLLLILLATRLIFLPEFWQEFKKDHLTAPLLVFILAAAISLCLLIGLIDNTKLLAASLYLARFIVSWSLYYALKIESWAKNKTRLKMAAIIFVIVGFVQYFLYPDLRFLKAIGFDDHYYRLTGGLLDPNFAGLILAVLFLLNLNSKRKAIVFIRSLFLLLAISLTFSRAAYLTVGFGLLVYSVLKKEWAWLIFLLVLGLAVYFVPKPFGEGVNLWRTFSISSRLSTDQFGFKLFLVNPITGVGFNTLKNLASVNGAPNLSSGIDNSYLFVLATTGLVGFTAFIYLIVRTLSKLTVTNLTACLAILFHSLFNNSFFYSWILLLYLVLISHRPKERSLPSS